MRALLTSLFVLTLAPGLVLSQSLGTSSHPIVNGTRQPEALDLTDGEQLAIGWISDIGAPASTFCTGTLITSRVVLSAAHCFSSPGRRFQFGLGEQPTEAQFVFDVERVENHPTEDIALLFLAEDAVDAVPSLTPIRHNRHGIDGKEGEYLIETMVQAGGYGDTLSGSTGRFYTSLLLEEITALYVIVNGRGASGLCRGDSGSAVLAMNVLGKIVVLGVEHAGEETCVGRDQLTRTDIPHVRDWIEQGIADTRTYSPEGSPCRGLDYLGRCVGTVAEWCDVDRIRRRDCQPEGRLCAFVNREVGYFCGPEINCEPGSPGCYGVGEGRDGFDIQDIVGVRAVGACHVVPGQSHPPIWILYLAGLFILLRRRP